MSFTKAEQKIMSGRAAQLYGPSAHLPWGEEMLGEDKPKKKTRNLSKLVHKYLVENGYPVKKVVPARAVARRPKAREAIEVDRWDLI